jgi:hypothetical protein
MSDLASLSELAEKFQSFAASLDVEPHFKVFRTSPQHDGSPHIEAVAGKFQFVVTERGSEFERIKDLSADDVLYLLLEGVTHHMATRYELQNRLPGGDGRSVWFPYQERLMESMNHSWGQRLREKHRRVLEEHPFRP